MSDLEHITKLLLNIEESILNLIMSQTNSIPRNLYSIEIALRMINIDIVQHCDHLHLTEYVNYDE